MRIRWLCLAGLVLVLGACSQGAGATVVPATVAPATAAAASPCLDVGDLSDEASPLATELQGILDALKAGKVDEARSLATSAEAGLQKLATTVGTIAPDAAPLLLAAGTDLESAVKAFPQGADLVDKARKDLDDGYNLARAKAC